MADYGTTAEMKKIFRTEQYKPAANDVRKNVLSEHFEAIICDSTGENEEALTLY